MISPECLTDELLAELIDGRLSEETLVRIHLHAAECPSCYTLLCTVVRGGVRQETLDSPPPPGPGAVPPLHALEGTPASLWVPPPGFDEFRLVRLLGRGGMGMVYLAHDLTLDRQVAVKFIATYQHSAHARERFLIEARAIARLQHPNVVTVFRVGEVEGHPYIVSEYLEGQSLGDLPLPLPWRRVLTLGLGLARGLAAAHRQGVLHRDIKPSNVFLTAGGEVKLLDFGLAELIEPGSPGAEGEAGALVGTPRYMAPELFRGASAAPRSDLYALGLVLYELCTGELPTPRDPPPPGGAQGAGHAEPPRRSLGPPLAERVPGVDLDFAALIDRCLRLDPEERFASAEALCAALERLEQPLEPGARATGNPYRGLAPFEAEHRALFFGRDADVRAVIDRLRRQPQVLVAGDSGVGKSSLCRAGVLPGVARGALDEFRDFTLLTIEPGRRPLAALVAALAPVLGRPESDLTALLAAGPGELGAALRAAHQQDRGLLLFVDQLEELVTFSEPAQAARFAALLGELALPAAGVRVLLAVRGDFLTRVGALPGLGEQVERALYILRPMSPEGVREAIVGPARSRGVVFESDALIQMLVASTAQGAGSLPLLQFALAELWERRDPAQDRLTRAALDEMGGVAGALSRHADGVLARLSPAEREAARRLLLQLVTGEGTRIERREEELGSDPALQAALRALVERRLVHARTAGGQACYEVAHDALIASWGTLRNWLDDDIGHRAVRQRIEAASAEWERLARAREALWGRRQLDEVGLLDTSTLGSRERAFLLASRHAWRRQRQGRWIAALVVVLALVTGFGSRRVLAYNEDMAFVAARIGEARQAFDKCRDLERDALRRRDEALKKFDGGADGEPNDDKTRDDANERWEAALAVRHDADVACVRGVQFVEEALDWQRDNRDARLLLLELTFQRMVLAEEFNRKDDRDELKQRLSDLVDNTPDVGGWWEQHFAPAELVVVTEPPGASVAINRYETDKHGVRKPRSERLGVTPITARLPEGSYVLHFTMKDRAPVDQPLVLRRGDHERVDLKLPPAPPPGYAYIPPGYFFYGSAEPERVRTFMYAAPLHRLYIGKGYLIGKTEVTFGDWLAYLKTLPPGAPARRILEQPHFTSSTPAAITLRHGPGDKWIFAFLRQDKRGIHTVLEASEEQPIRYPGRLSETVAWSKLPLSGVSAEDLEGYFDWLKHSGKLPGARLCTEQEWERAARGADDREYPHGDYLAREDANIDSTYGRKDFGPDVVGSHPSSVSPFGLLDMAGNAFEMTQPMTLDLGRIVLRGGSWYNDDGMATVTNRASGDRDARDVRIGLRVCASYPP